jgi:nucleoside-diphosphate-sugar epimerase
MNGTGIDDAIDPRVCAGAVAGGEGSASGDAATFAPSGSPAGFPAGDPAGSAPEPPLVVVTGAGGFIGRHLVRALRQSGYRVRAVTRGAAGSGGAATDATCEVPHPGVAPDADWGGALAGAAAVVHLAGLAHLPLDDHRMRQRLRRINVLSTQRLAAAAAQAGVSDFIFMSSIKALSDHSDGEPLTERDPPLPQDCYGLAKLATERRLRRLGNAAPAMRILVLRPPLVYGPGVGANFAALAGLVRRGLPLPLGGIRNRRSLIYVGNLTAAVLRCLERPDVPSGTFHVSDAAAVSTPELMRAIAQAQDRPLRLLNLPVGWLALAAAAVGRRAQFARLAGSLEVSNQHFCRSFDWRPPFTMQQGLRATLQPDT